MRSIRSWLVVVVALAAAHGRASADPQPFNVAESYGTLAAGKTHLGLASATSFERFARGAPSAFELELGLAQGLSSHWDLEVESLFDQSTGEGTLADPGQPLRLALIETRLRYRVAEPGTLPVNVAVATAVLDELATGRWTIEPWITLSRQLGPVVIAVDPSLDIEVGHGQPGAKIDMNWAGGIAVRAHRKLYLGVEGWGGFHIRDATRPGEATVGPVVTWVPARNLGVAVTGGFGLTDATNAFTFVMSFALGL